VCQQQWRLQLLQVCYPHGTGWRELQLLVGSAAAVGWDLSHSSYHNNDPQ